MSSGGDDRARLQQLQELLPDVPVAQLQRLVHSTNSLEHAVALHFSKAQQSATSTSAFPSPAAKASAVPPREVHTIDDDDEQRTDGPAAGTDDDDAEDERRQLWDDDRHSASNGDEHIEAEHPPSSTDQHLSAPSSPRPSSASSSPAASPRKPKPAAVGARKRKGGSGGGGGSGSGGKRRREVKKRDKDQRSIASFFDANRRLQAVAAKRSQPTPTADEDLKEEVEEVDRMADATASSSASVSAASAQPAPSLTTAAPVPSPPLPASSTVQPPSLFTQSSHALPSLSSTSTSLPSTPAAIHALLTGPPCWQPPNPVPYLHLARTFRAIELETGRILITNHLTLMLWRILDLSPLDLPPALFLSLNHLAPPYENLQLHIGGSIVGRCVRDVTGRSREQMRDDFVRWGDLGDVAQQYKARQNVLRAVEPLTARGVYNSVYGLSKLVGAGNGKRKEEVVKRLLIACREYETCYLVRTLLQDMRIGGAVTTVLNALAKAFVLHAHYTSKEAARESGTLATWERVVHCTNKDSGSPLLALAQTIPTLQAHPIISSLPTHSLHAVIRQATSTLRHCYSQHPNLRTILAALLSHPLSIFTLLDSTHLAPSVPCKPMLGKIAAGVHAMLRRMRGQPFSCEVKYDGLRAQIHMVKGQDGYRVFSRHLMEQSERWKDLWDDLDSARRKGVKREKDDERDEVQSFIMDAEIVAVEVNKDIEAEAASGEQFRILPFQTLTTRKRKMDGAAASEQRVEVRCMVYCFDLILLNDRPLLELSLADRRRLLYSHFDEVPAGFQFVEHVDVTQEESECIAVEEDDEGDDEAAAPTAKGKRGGKKADADNDAEEGESSASEQEDEAKEAEADDDPLFSRKQRANGKEKVKAQDDSVDEVQVVDEEEEEKVAPTAVVATNGKKKEVKLEHLTDEQVEKGAAAFQRIVAFLHSSGISRGEGLMTKSLSPLSQYLPDFRTDSWVKLKRDYIAGLSVGDALDVVPIGAWWGNGRKAGWYSPVLLAVYNPETERLETLCKCMSGFTDAHYQQLVHSFAPRVLPRPRPYYAVDEQLTPQVWFDADRVWEIRGADLTLSPKHSAGRGEVPGGRGISLRFPRFIRVREDKGVEDATSTQQIVELFHQQSRKGSAAAGRAKRGTR